MFDRIAFVIGEAMIALRRHANMTFSSITTVAIALYLLGGLGFAYVRAIAFAETIPSKFEIRVFLKDHTKAADISETAKAIRGMPGVASVNWIPRAKAWAKYRNEHPRLTQGLDNPFPDAYKVTLSQLDKATAIADNIRSLPIVDQDPESVQYLADEQRFVDGIIKVLGGLSSLGILLLAIAGILIFNTIRIAIISRRTEIRIMQLVGASRLTMGVPFLIEGLLQGLTGGFLAALFVWASYRTIELRLLSTLNATWPPFPAVNMILLLGAVGATFGALCSLLALQVRHHT